MSLVPRSAAKRDAYAVMARSAGARWGVRLTRPRADALRAMRRSAARPAAASRFRPSRALRIGTDRSRQDSPAWAARWSNASRCARRSATARLRCCIGSHRFRRQILYGSVQNSQTQRLPSLCAATRQVASISRSRRPPWRARAVRVVDRDTLSRIVAFSTGRPPARLSTARGARELMTVLAQALRQSRTCRHACTRARALAPPARANPE
ncbi:hypothetical protein X949_4551 [Burkholderia pseudomallei MSHR5609]|nr:hypothetical protein X949_4551 [Burkholderia pseudomallei MSHR5609]